MNEKLSQLDSSLGKRLEHKLVLLELSQKAADIYHNRIREQKHLMITELFENVTANNETVSVSYTNFSRVIADSAYITTNLIGGTK